jgi:hypothetical protein
MSENEQAEWFDENPVTHELEAAEVEAAPVAQFVPEDEVAIPGVEEMVTEKAAQKRVERAVNLYDALSEAQPEVLAALRLTLGVNRSTSAKKLTMTLVAFDKGVLKAAASLLIPDEEPLFHYFTLTPEQQATVWRVYASLSDVEPGKLPKHGKASSIALRDAYASQNANAREHLAALTALLQK